jgi:hypothetical protein
MLAIVESKPHNWKCSEKNVVKLIEPRLVYGLSSKSTQESITIITVSDIAILTRIAELRKGYFYRICSTPGKNFSYKPPFRGQTTTALET